MTAVYTNEFGVPPLKAGEWAWVLEKEGDTDPFYLAYGCPCGTNCRKVNCIIPVARVKVTKSWAWDGNWDEPTLKPSIQRRGDCNWHGFMTKGQFVKV